MIFFDEIENIRILVQYIVLGIHVYYSEKVLYSHLHTEGPSLAHVAH